VTSKNTQLLLKTPSSNAVTVAVGPRAKITYADPLIFGDTIKDHDKLNMGGLRFIYSEQGLI
jgi:hypothetical protein